jgi:hypothetical protein
MRTVEIEVYQYSELSEMSKQSARDWYCEGLEYYWWNDSIQSVKDFCALFNVSVKDYSVGAFIYSWIETDASNEHFRGWDKKRINALKDKEITGYYIDCVLIDALIEMYALNGDAKSAFLYAIDCAVKDIVSDWEYQYSEEAVSEMMEVNCYEFDEDGNRI